MPFRNSFFGVSLRLTVLAVVAYVATPLIGQTTQPTAEREPLADRRIVMHFDYNERPHGNYSNTPRAWHPVRGEGFPRYLEAQFDDEVGHRAEPSFRFDLNGGSLAYSYEGRDIRMQPNSDYLIVAWVKTSGLEEARAYMTVYLLDRRNQRIPGTERRSELIGGRGADTEWQPLSVGLHGNVRNAQYIGITLWVTQQQMWDARPFPKHYIHREDIEGTAWFDDLTVFRMPRATLRTSNPGNVFDSYQPVELLAEVTDPDGLNLEATVHVRAVDETYESSHSVAIQSHHDQAQRIVIDEMPVGLYRADLVVGNDETQLVRRTLDFVKLARRHSPPTATGLGFGVVLKDTDLQFLAGQAELMRHLRGEYVKIPAWRAQQAAVAGELLDTKPTDRYLEAIVDSQADPIGVLQDDLTTDVAGNLSAVQLMLDMFSEDSLLWKPLVATVWGRYAGLIHVWQLGADDDNAVFLDYRLPDVLATLREEMRTLMSNPLLATGVPVFWEPTRPLGVDYRAFEIPATVPLESFADYAEPLITSPPRHTWITVEPLDSARYPREQRLADLARRLAEARFLGVGGVFLDAPWKNEAGLLATQVNPQEDYIVLRTLADMLGDAVPVARMTIRGWAQCLVFDRNGRAIVFAWDDYAPPEGREHRLLLGEHARQVDLWGNIRELPTVGGQQVVRIGPTPTFIMDTPTWLMEFRRQFVFTPPLLEASFRFEEREIAFTNTYHDPISGVVKLVGPPGWDIRPPKIAFALQPGEQFKTGVRLRFPVNAESEVKAVLGDFMIDADRRMRLITPAWFELGLEDIDVHTYPLRTDDRIIVRTTLTNRTDGPVNFDADLVVPGRQRIERLFANIVPGQTVTKDFVIRDLETLTGPAVRLALRERNGSRLFNRVIELP